MHVHVFIYCSSCVRVFKSVRAGMGKSLYIQRMEEQLSTQCKETCHVVIPVHGPKVTFDTIVQLLKNSTQQRDHGKAVIYHIDISPSVSIIT